MSDNGPGLSNELEKRSYRGGDLVETFSLLEDLPALIAIIDQRQRYCRVNRAYRILFRM